MLRKNAENKADQGLVKALVHFHTVEVTGSNPVDREQAAGSFSIDLVAEDEGGCTVIIENQLKKSNHDHLGKLITNLAAVEAKAAIWLVSDPRPEHVAAIAWYLAHFLSVFRWPHNQYE